MCVAVRVAPVDLEVRADPAVQEVPEAPEVSTVTEATGAVEVREERTVLTVPKALVGPMVRSSR
jgi:hypothetical protein